MKRWLGRYLWLVILIVIFAGIVFFTFTGNDTLLPAIYR